MYLLEKQNTEALMGRILGFQDLDRFYDRLGKDGSHFINSNDICTPLGCVKEMVDVIPRGFWNRKDIRVLDPCCGNGNFHAYLKQRHP